MKGAVQLLVSSLTVILFSCGVTSPIIVTVEENTQLDPIEALLSKMTVEEKVGQTCQITLDVITKFENDRAVSPIELNENNLKEALLKYKVGSVLNVGYHTLSQEEWSTVYKSVHQHYLSGQTKIPVIYGIDAIHGMNYAKGSTLFPQEIGLAATWNTDLTKRVAEATAYEVRASGIPWNFSPVLDLGRQPLWSRHFETFGEDPYLCAEMGSAMIKGYQGENADKIDSLHVAACMKHFVGYSASFSGRDRTPAWIPEKYMRELYLPSFKKAVESGALTVMINSGVVNGVPGHVNYHLLTEVLKGEFGFEGFAVSDWEDFIMLHTVHKTSSTLEDAFISAFNAGVDMSMVPLSPQYKEYCEIMVKAVNEGKIDTERLNDAVRRILKVKQKLGLFELQNFEIKDYPNFASDEFKALAEKAALESITLLKNTNNTLPLKKNQKVLVAGPTSDNLVYLNGAWTHTWQGADTNFNTVGCKTIKQSFESFLGKGNVLFSKGAELFYESGFEKTRNLDLDDYRKKAKESDIIILCLGESPSTEKPGDIHSLNLDKEQLILAEIAYELGKPVVILLLEGRPRIIREIVDKSGAIVQCYLPGDYGANAIVKLLYGKENFSGKLPYTYPKYDGVIEFYDHPKSVDRSKSGDFSAYDPQWDFGYGLSYSEVEYSNISISSDLLSEGENLIVSVDIKNKGQFSTNEIVQLYLTDEYATFTPEGKKLKRFRKIELNPGEIKKETFTINSEDLIFYDNDENKMLESGSYVLTVGNQKINFFFNKK